MLVGVRFPLLWYSWITSCFQSFSIYLWVIYMKLVKFLTFISLNADKYVKKCVIIFKWSIIKAVLKQFKWRKLIPVHWKHTKCSHLLTQKGLSRIMNWTAYILVLFLIFNSSNFVMEDCILFLSDSLAKSSNYFCEELQHIILGLDISDVLVERSHQCPIVSRKSSQNNLLNYLLIFF